jgi:AraC-like DNA-binding protein
MRQGAPLLLAFQLIYLSFRLSSQHGGLMKSSRLSQQVPISTIASAPRLLVEAAVDPDLVAEEAGLDSARFSAPGERISFRDMGRYLMACVKATGDDAFALRVGLAEGPGALNTLGFLVVNTSDVRGALATLARYLHQVAGMVELSEEGELALFEYSFFFPNLAGAQYISDAAMGLSLAMLRTLCGPAWVPTEVRFTRRAPGAPQLWRNLTRAPVWFGVERNLIVFPAHWLDRGVERADPELRQILLDKLGDLEARGRGSDVERISAILRSCVLANAASLPEVAGRLAVSPATLKRRLAAGGTSFSQLLDKVRFDLACQLLRDSSASMAQIAEVLGYGHTSTFSRAFGRWAKTSPRQWRRRATTGVD